MPLKRPSSIMSRWKARWAELRVCLRSLGLEAPPATVSSPWTRRRAVEFEQEMGYLLPGSLREFFRDCASLIVCSYETPDAVATLLSERPRFTFDGYLSISAGAIASLSSLMVEWSQDIEKERGWIPERYRFACPVGCVDPDEPISFGIVCVDRRPQFDGRVFIATREDFCTSEETHVADSVFEYIDVITDLVYWKPGRWLKELDFYENRGHRIDSNSQAARERRVAFGLPAVSDRG